MKAWFLSLTRAGKTVVVSALTILGIGTVGALGQPPQETPSTTVPAVIQTVEKSEPAKATTKRIVEKQTVPFETTNRPAPDLDIGQSRVAQEGVDGTREITYEVTLHGEREVSRKEVSSIVTVGAVSRIIDQGTRSTPPPAAAQHYDCPNGTYRNSAGNTVCRPYESSGAPEGATARCKNGSYSFSQSRRGTCSRNGGVAQWL